MTWPADCVIPIKVICALFVEAFKLATEAIRQDVVNIVELTIVKSNVAALAVVNPVQVAQHTRLFIVTVTVADAVLDVAGTI